LTWLLLMLPGGLAEDRYICPAVDDDDDEP
jgi:hypothetical protein